MGCRVRQESCRVKSLSCVLIARRALYVWDDDPVEVSWEGESAILKSPPTSSIPFWKVVSRCKDLRKKSTWCLLGTYKLASVIGLL